MAPAVPNKVNIPPDIASYMSAIQLPMYLLKQGLEKNISAGGPLPTEEWSTFEKVVNPFLVTSFLLEKRFLD